MCGTCAKLMWRGTDMWQSYASPCGPTWMPTWRDESRAKCVCGPTEGIWERTRPVAGEAKGLSPSTFYTHYFHLFLSVWD